MFGFGWQAWALLGAGALAIAAEIFFPSVGMLTLVALLCFGGGGLLAWQAGGTAMVGGYALVAIVLAAASVLIALQLLPRTPFGRRMMLAAQPDGPRAATEAGLAPLRGKSGTAETPLRPAGIALVEGRRVDVVTRGAHIESGAAVRIVKVEGNRVIVEMSS